jgi:hypothetical protein
MKKTILSAIAIAGLTATGFGQGVIYLDGSNNNNASLAAASEGQVFLNGVHDTGTDVNATLLGGASAGSLVPIVTLLLSDSTTTANTTPGGNQPAAGDITDFNAGNIFDASGVGYVLSTVAVGGTGFFQIEAWTGIFSSYAAAQAGPNGTLAGITSVFTEVMASPTGTANDIENAGALNLVAVPEPTTLALAGLGGAALLALRRKQV